MMTMPAEEPVVMLAWNLESHRLSSSDDGTSRERVIDHDKRTRVKSEDFHVNGKYRPTVKLWMQYSGCRFVGSGWLASKSVVATAAHNVYDSNEPWYGRVEYVEASVAYCGKVKQTTDALNAQFRSGARILVPSSWYCRREFLHDFAFIELDSPFEDVEPLVYQPTPLVGSGYLGVVGYPGDRCYGDEPGAEMYEEFRPVEWNLSRTDGYLTYPVSTGRGNSGSPVVMRDGDKYIAIATHIQGSKGKNLASPIGTDPVNSYHAIIEQFFNAPWPEPREVINGLEFHPPASSAPYQTYEDCLSILAGTAIQYTRDLFAGLKCHESSSMDAGRTLALESAARSVVAEDED